MRDELIDVGEVRLHVVRDGAGPPVLLLHGFPEFWMWRRQIEALAHAGLTAIAPDLRGYGESDKPRGIGSYSSEKLLADIDGLLAALGHERVALVGHDWGGALAWAYAASRPQRVDKLVILNAPHPTLFFERHLRSWRQLRKSWYMFFFVMPWLPERWSMAPGRMEKQLRKYGARQDRITREMIDRYEENMRRPGAATAMINYYRAAMLNPRPVLARITVPTKIILGQDDPVLGPEVLDGIEDYVDDVSIERVRGAGHWVETEAAEEVSRALVELLRPGARS